MGGGEVEDEALLVAALKRGARGRLDAITGDQQFLGAALGRLSQAGQAAFPDLVIPPERLAEHLGGLVDGTGDAQSLALQIGELHAADLHLACACAIGVAGAAEVFDREQLARVPAHLSRLRLSPVVAGEVRQLLAIKLLVGSEGSRPRIVDYAGRGTLATWVRVAAVRTAMDHNRGRADRPLDEAVADPGAIAGTPQLDPELEYVKRRYAADFQGAVRASLSALPEDQRELLWLNVVERLNIEAIGERKNLHRATIARRIAAARSAVFEDTKRRLRDQLGVESNDFKSLVGVLRSDLDLSMAGALGGGGTVA